MIFAFSKLLLWPREYRGKTGRAAVGKLWAGCGVAYSCAASRPQLIHSRAFLPEFSTYSQALSKKQKIKISILPGTVGMPEINLAALARCITLLAFYKSCKTPPLNETNVDRAGQDTAP